MALTGFEKRVDFTKPIENLLLQYLKESGFIWEETGSERLNNQDLTDFLKLDESKKSGSALFVRYSPDFLMLHVPTFKQGKYEKAFFFLDTKVSITPVYLDKQVERIRQSSNILDIGRTRIGEIEREALDTYRKYPNVALLLACSYNPLFLLCEWTEKLKEIYRLKEGRNIKAAGSTTPHVNIDLSHMRKLDNFLKIEFGVQTENFDNLIDKIKPYLAYLGKPRWVDNNIASNIKEKLEEICSIKYNFVSLGKFREAR